MCSRDVRRWTFTSEIIFMFKGHSAFELCRNLLNFLLHRLTQNVIPTAYGFSYAKLLAL